MKEKDILSFSCIELVSLFEREFPTIMQGANLSKDWKEFEQFLRGYVRLALTTHSTSSSIKRFFRMRLLECIREIKSVFLVSMELEKVLC